MVIASGDGSLSAIAKMCPGWTPRQRRANARRIVATVNACEGVPTEALEAGVVAGLLAAVEEALANTTMTRTPYRDMLEAAIAKAKS